MKKLAFLLLVLVGLLCLCPFCSHCQTIQFTAATPHTAGTPSGTPATNGSWIRYDKTNKILYRWTGSTWAAMTTLSDGDYGDIVVTSSGSVWDIDTGVVGPTELASTAVVAGTYGSSTQVPQVIVDADGRLISVTNITITGTAPGGAAGGDLTGTYPNPDIATGVVGANELSSTTVTPGTYGSSSAVSQITIDADGRVTSASNVTITGTAPGGAAGGDLTGTYPNPDIATGVVGANELSSTTVTLGSYGSATQVPQFTVDADGRLTAAANVTISGTAPGGAAGGDLTGTYPNPDIATAVVGANELSSTTVSPASYGSATQVGQFTVDADGRLTAASNVTITGTVPGGAAGGSLSGTYPNPGIATGAVGPTEIASTAVSAGTYGSTTQAPQFTVDADGRLTAASNNTISNLAGVSVITPSQITTDQDNYSPTGWDAATTVRLSFDSDINAITSFASQTDGERKILRNVGSYPGYIPAEHPDGTAANRVYGEGDYILYPYGGTMVIEYDGTLSRWVVVSNTYTPANNVKSHYYRFAAGSTTEADYDNLGFRVASGTHTTTVGSASLPGVLNLSTSTSATGLAAVYFSKNMVTPTAFSSAHMIYSSWVYIPILSTGTQRFVVHVSLSSTPNSGGLDVNNSFGFRYSDNINGGNWQGFTRDNAGAETVVDTGVAAAATTPYLLTVCYDKTETEIRFYINYAYVGRLNAGFPATTTSCGSRAVISKTVGTTERVFAIASMLFYDVY